MIMLWGLPEEESLAAVHRALHAERATTVMVDQRRALSIRYLPGPDGPLLALSGRRIPLMEVTAAYPRPYPFVPRATGAGRPARLVALRHITRLERCLWHWLATTPATVVNRLGPSASNFTKPMQTRVARSCGFRVPCSLLTNDLEQLRAFVARHGMVVYKAAGGMRTYTAMLDLADARRLGRLSTCPTYFQQFIAGTNVRVHVVGTELFGVEIHSDAVDYRQGADDMAATVLPEPVARQCLAVTGALGLLVAGIDLIRGSDGEWFFLEANPSPAFTCYPGSEQVGAAIARLLIGRAAFYQGA
jgi:hypothetical protein